MSFIGPVLTPAPYFMAGMPKDEPTPEPQLPEFRFSPRRDQRATFLRNVAIDFARGEVRARHRRPRPPIQIIGRPGDSRPIGLARQHAVRAHEGTADETWVTKFTTKFAKKPDPADLPSTPTGALKVIAEFLSRVEELAHYESSQCCAYHAQGGDQHEHRGHVNELATTLDDLRRARVQASSLDTASDVALQIAQADTSATHYGVQIDDEHFGDPLYIAAMERRIEWEQYWTQNGPLHRARFERTTDGRTGIEALSRSRDKEFLLDLRRKVKTEWLKRHDALPDPDTLPFDTAGIRILARLDDNEQAAYNRSIHWSDEDDDPGRIAMHADPDPKPARDQYAFGPCTIRCEMPMGNPWDPESIHHHCTFDGWALYALDLAMWEHRQTDRGYAGPQGFLGLDVEFQTVFEKRVTKPLRS